MAKLIDITEKLNYEENPKIKVGNTEIEVNADAATMLQIMGVMSSNENAGPKEVIKMYELLFNDKEREKIKTLKLNFADFTTLIQAAVGLIAGENRQGE